MLSLEISWPLSLTTILTWSIIVYRALSVCVHRTYHQKSSMLSWKGLGVFCSFHLIHSFNKYWLTTLTMVALSTRFPPAVWLLILSMAASVLSNRFRLCGAT
jgi:hypothetical protein